MPRPYVPPQEAKSDYAYRVLRDQIISGQLESGAILNQRDLANSHGISTTPLREALRRLASEGLIELDTHRNGKVTELRAEEARDLLETRRSLDPLAAALAAERRTTQDLQDMRDALAILAPLPVHATLEELWAHRKFHTTIYRASHNAILIATLDTLWDKADRYRLLALGEDRGQQARDQKRREHERMVELIAAGDSRGSSALMLRHINTSLGATAIWRLGGGPIDMEDERDASNS